MRPLTFSFLDVTLISFYRWGFRNLVPHINTSCPRKRPCPDQTQGKLFVGIFGDENERRINCIGVLQLT
jgi:hypothetical protein